VAQGRKALCRLLSREKVWPPVVVPFGLDPFGWHGSRPSYEALCAYALDRCTLLPKVYPFADPLCSGPGRAAVKTDEHVGGDGTRVRRHRLSGAARPLFMEEVQRLGDSSWMLKKPWIGSDADLEAFLELPSLSPAAPDLESLREKERQVGRHGLPYAEVVDPFSLVASLFPTEDFYIRILTDPATVERLIGLAQRRVLASLEQLYRGAGCPFILRLIGAEAAAPPFLSRKDFLRLSAPFYREASRLAERYSVPRAVHCHGPVREIMGDVWEMGYDLLEPFEPAPRGNVSIAEALESAGGRGIVFGGVDDVLLQTGCAEDVRAAVTRCLDDARRTGGPFILSQSATPFTDPLGGRAEANLMLFLETGTAEEDGRPGSQLSGSQRPDSYHPAS